MANLTRFVPVLCLALLALATWWLADQVRRNSEPAPPNSPQRPDFIVEGVRMSRLGPTGQVQALIRAVTLTHTPDGDVALLDHPQVVYTLDAAPTVTMTADSGVSSNANETIDLAGNVRVTRGADASGPPMLLETERLRVRPDDDTASSDVFVRVDRGGSVAQGVGMNVNNAFRQIEIQSRARGTLPAQGTP